MIQISRMALISVHMCRILWLKFWSAEVECKRSLTHIPLWRRMSLWWGIWQVYEGCHRRKDSSPTRDVAITPVFREFSTSSKCWSLHNSPDFKAKIWAQKLEHKAHQVCQKAFYTGKGNSHSLEWGNICYSLHSSGSHTFQTYGLNWWCQSSTK